MRPDGCARCCLSRLPGGALTCRECCCRVKYGRGRWTMRLQAGDVILLGGFTPPQGGCCDITRGQRMDASSQSFTFALYRPFLHPAHPPPPPLSPPPPPNPPPRLISQGSNVTCILMSTSDNLPSPRQPPLGRRLMTICYHLHWGCLV